MIYINNRPMSMQDILRKVSFRRSRCYRYQNVTLRVVITGLPGGTLRQRCRNWHQAIGLVKKFS